MKGIFIMDNRRRLESGYELVADDNKVYTIISEIGRGGSCIVYDGIYNDSRNLEHNARIKECYPYGIIIKRQDDGTLIPENKELFIDRKNKFITAYEEGVNIKNKSGLVNSSVNTTTIFQRNNTEYIVTDYFEGVTYDKIQENNLDDLMQTTLAIAKIIKKYHEYNLLYLDLKPDNVLIMPESREHVVLFDFDSVRNMQQINESEDIGLAVSDEYAAPEQKNAKYNEIGFHTDIYSLGVLVFEKIFGRRPCAVEQSITSIYDFTMSERINFAEYSSVITELLTFFFHKTLSISIKTRWRQMQDVIGILKKIIRINSESVFIKNMRLDAIEQNVRFDIKKIKDKIENIRCQTITEYQGKMNQKTYDIIVQMFEMNSDIVRLYKNGYMAIFDNIYNAIEVLICSEGTKQEVFRIIEQAKKILIQKMDEALDFKEIEILNINVQNEDPREITVLNLGKPDTWYTKLFGKADIEYSIPLECELHIVEQIEKILSYNEGRCRKEYKDILEKLFDNISAIIGDEWKLGIEKDCSLYQCAMQYLYSSNVDKKEEGLRLLFSDYAETKSPETAKEIDKQLPIYEGEVLDYLNNKVLFIRKKSDYDTGGQLLFGYKDINGKEFIFFNCITKYATNNVNYKALGSSDVEYVLMEDNEQLLLYQFDLLNDAVNLIGQQNLQSIWGDLILFMDKDNALVYGKNSFFDSNKVVYKINL